MNDTHAIPAGDEPDHVAAFLAQDPQPGQIFLDNSGRPYLIDKGNEGLFLTRLGTLSDSKPSMAKVYGPLTRAQIVPADAIVLEKWAARSIRKALVDARAMIWPIGQTPTRGRNLRQDEAIDITNRLDHTGNHLAACIAEAPHDAPAKTHDLTVRRDTTAPDRVMIGAEDAVDDYRLYLPVDEAKLLGRMLKVLTPTQVAILADALTDGAL